MSKHLDQPGSPEDAASVRIDDPRSIRALAHPARMAIINALSTGEELTATQCAELTGLSPSATAYHLKFLERHGYAEVAPQRADHRERPWRASTRPHLVELDASTPAGAAASAATAIAYFDTTREIGLTFTEGAYTEPEEWRKAADLNIADLWLTVEESRRVAAELAAVVRPYRKRELRNRPADSRRVRVMSVVVPHRRAHPDPDPPQA